MTLKTQKYTALAALASATLLGSFCGARLMRATPATAMVEQSSEAQSKAEEECSEIQTTIQSEQKETSKETEESKTSEMATNKTETETSRKTEMTTINETTSKSSSTAKQVTSKASSITEATTTKIASAQTSISTTAEAKEVDESSDNPNESANTNAGSISLDDLKISFDMDVSVPTGLSRDDFITLIEKCPYDKKGYFSRNAGVIWDECNELGVNEIFVCGITAWESGWGRVAGFGKNNYFGIRGGKYATEADGIHGLVSLLAKRYLHEGGSCYHGATITGVSHCYCEPNEWPKKVYECMSMIVSSKSK